MRTTENLKQSYELVNNDHNKFWVAEVCGCHYITTYGKIGSKGSTHVKTLNSAREAVAMADKMIREKIGKGYVQVRTGEHPGAEPALIQSLLGVATGPREQTVPARPTPQQNERHLGL